VLNLSDKLAEFAPQLTLDFIHEVSAAMTSMDKGSVSHRISCLQYMSPWIKNLSHFANATHPLFERSGARLRDCIRTLSDLSLAFPEVRFVLVLTCSSRWEKAYMVFLDYFHNPEARLG
jgi:neurofibromin 1